MTIIWLINWKTIPQCMQVARNSSTFICSIEGHGCSNLKTLHYAHCNCFVGKGLCGHLSTFKCFFLYSYPHKERVDARESYTLDSIRHFLIRQEDSIIFSLLERAQYCYNADTYDHHAFSKDGFHGSLVEFMVKETEKLHAQVF